MHSYKRYPYKIKLDILENLPIYMLEFFIPETWDSWGIMQSLLSIIAFTYVSVKASERMSQNIFLMIGSTFVLGLAIILLTGAGMFVLKREASYVGIDNAFVALGSIIFAGLFIAWVKKQIF